MLKSFISKALVLTLSFVFLGLVSPFEVKATSINFVKDSQNPLSANFFLLQTTISKENNDYKMWFTGHNGSNLKLGYSTSADGKNWPSSTFVTVNDTGDNHDPSLFIQNGTNYIYYISEPAEGSGQNIKIKRTVANGSILSEPQLISLPRQPWNSQKLSCPYVFHETSSYFLFYCGTNGTGFNLGMAQSTDGVNFTPCSNNPIISGSTIGNSQLYVDDIGTKHLLFHSNNGIEEVESTGVLSCNSVWSNRKTIVAKDKPYDQSQIISPSLVNGASTRELYYTARGPGTTEAWKLNKSTEEMKRPKIVLVPGFFASWNKDAVLYNKTVTQADWKIPNYIQEYKALIQTLENLGLKADTDFFVFPYDWRKPISTTADELRVFLQTKIWSQNPTTPVNLVGHSMGGVVSRIYAQKYPSDNVSKVVTVGSPHRGVVQVYQPVAAGETQKDDTFLWLGTKLLINLNRRNFSTDKVTVQSILPSLFDLLPTFPFLRNLDGTFKPLNSMSIKNDLLGKYENLESVSGLLTVMYGNKSASGTPTGYRLINRAIIDKISRDYVDGRPFGVLKGPGDYLVPTISSKVGNTVQELQLDHGEIIYTKTAIRKILEALSLNFNENSLVEGSPTKISSALIIAIQSPIEASVQIGEQIYKAEDGLIFIPDAQTGSYFLRVKKLAPGDYTVTVAQVALKNDVWEQFTGTIESLNVNEEDSYTIKFNQVAVRPQISKARCYKLKSFLFRIIRRFPCRIKNIQIR